ncbi:MAG: mannitol dehydrogenase family protein [Rhizobiaceae bacterium]|nr:mannitol dehydrogenase family protein [Hyphomicrobiales bacterium]NRB32357.1 mannitol dehydrogenase family protein [Rhizobiaceae bacterium]
MPQNSPSDIPRLSRASDAPKPGIVHFGPGAFFRAFNAPFTDDAMRQQGVDDWGILAVSLKSAGARDSLRPQGCAYTVVELAPTSRQARRIGAICDVMVAPEDPAAVVDILSDPTIKIASLTVTEKGYCHNPSTGGLDFAHPDIAHDLADLAKPRSVLGFLVAALRQRRAQEQLPFTIMSCDNLPSNGRLLRGLVLEFASAVDAELAQWIEDQVPFPCTMVDRITPATTDEDIAALATAEGYFDPACVVHEPFRQWVIEDRFVAGRPAWDQVGAQFVEDVEAHELMKLRCLNGTHSTLAYLGYLAGYETIAETVADPAFAHLCEKLWRDEILPTVPQPQGEDLEAYCQALLERYRNPAIRHRTWQIAMDGSQKLPQRLLGTISDNLNGGRVPDGLCLAVAGWIKYVGGTDEQGQAIDVRDPMAAELKTRLDGAADPAGKVAAVLSIDDVFDAELANNPDFRGTVVEAYERLSAQGAKSAVGFYVN